MGTRGNKVDLSVTASSEASRFVHNILALSGCRVLRTLRHCTGPKRAAKRFEHVADAGNGTRIDGEVRRGWRIKQ